MENKNQVITRAGFNNITEYLSELTTYGAKFSDDPKQAFLMTERQAESAKSIIANHWANVTLFNCGAPISTLNLNTMIKAANNLLTISTMK